MALSLGALGTAAALVLALACTGDTYEYGQSQKLPDPNALFPASGGGGDAGGDAGAQTACTPARYVDGSACEVSFARDIFAASMVAGKSWNCSFSTCHGGSAEPKFDNADAAAAYEVLAAYTTKGTTLRYINPCSTNPAESSFACNMHFMCGNGMPLGRQIPDSELVALEKWIACGAPNN